MEAVAYLMTTPEVFEAPPSEAYLCAIRRMLAESGGGAEPAVPLLRASSAAERAAGCGAVVELGPAWERPARVSTLRAACYEAGAAARPPWELPRRAAEAEQALRAIGVNDIATLCVWLRRREDGAPSPLLQALAAAGHATALDESAEAALAAALLSNDAEDEAAAPAEDGY